MYGIQKSDNSTLTYSWSNNLAGCIAQFIVAEINTGEVEITLRIRMCSNDTMMMINPH